jgi:hypothetical protein
MRTIFHIFGGIMKKISLIVCYFFVFTLHVCGMENSLMESPRLVTHLQSLSYITGLTNKKDVAWEIIIQYGIKHFNYTMIKALIVNTYFDELLRRTAEKRKAYVGNYTCCSNLQNQIAYQAWSLYGAINGNVGIERVGDECSRTLYIERQCLLHPIREPYYLVSEKFCDLLPHKPQPCFNSYGDFCFYGYGEISNASDNMSGTVAEYSLSLDGVDKIAECVTCVDRRLFKLKIFLEMPWLLEAILNSSEVQYRRVGRDNKLVKIFFLEGVTIPQNYNFHRKYFTDKIYGFFYNLPEELRKRIIALYKKQQQKKQKKALLKLISK